MPDIRKYIFVFFLALLLLHCGPKSDEELILELIEEISGCVEKKDIDSLLVYLADDYSDFEGRNKEETRDFIERYLRPRMGIVVNILSSEIEEIVLPEAYVKVKVALSSGASRVFRKLIRVSSDNYRVKVRLRNTDGAWKIYYAEWEYISLLELSPISKN